MTFPNDNLNQTAVYWANPVKDGYGKFTFDDPIEIDCRWIEKTKLIMNKNGDQINSFAQVQVNRDMKEQEMLFLGTLDDLDSSEEEDPQEIDNSIGRAYSIKRFVKIPSIDNQRIYRKVYL